MEEPEIVTKRRFLNHCLVLFEDEVCRVTGMYTKENGEEGGYLLTQDHPPFLTAKVDQSEFPKKFHFIGGVAADCNEIVQAYGRKTKTQD